ARAVQPRGLARRVDHESVGNVLDDQRVIAGCGEGAGQAREDAASVVVDGAGLAVHQPAARYGATEMLPDRLMAEADAEERPAGIGAGGHEIEADSRLVGGARAGRDEEAL